MRPAHRLTLSAAIVALAASLGSGAGVTGWATAPGSSGSGATEGLATTVRPAPAAGRPEPADEHGAGSAHAEQRPIEAIAERVERRSVDSAAPVVRLDDTQVALGTAVAITGRDFGAPRPLDLWRLGAARSARVAEGHSDADGSLVFPPLVLPAGEVTLVAAPRGSGPNGLGASSPTTLRRDPSAPRVERAATDALSLGLRVTPAEPGGAIVVVAPNVVGAIELARVPVAASPESSAASLPIALSSVLTGNGVEVVQELPDGRRSAPVSVALPSSVENQDADPIPMENQDADPIDVASP